MALYTAGVWTATEFAQAFDLQGAELTQANQIKVVIDGKANITLKMVYLWKLISAALVLGQKPDTTYPTPSPYFNANGTVNKARVASDLEIAG